MLEATASPPADRNRDAHAASQLRAGRAGVVWRKVIADCETPVAAAVKLIEPGRGDFLLESVEGGEIRGRYSLVGLDPDLVFRARGTEAEVNRDWRHDREAFVPSGPGTARRAAVAGSQLPVRRARRTAARAGLPGRLFRI